jgi:hypothetical protein
MFSLIVFYLILFSFLILTIIACFFAASLIVGLFMANGVPFVSSPAYDLENICKAAELKSGENIYDLGCGKANLLTLANKKFGAKGVGYEIALWPYFWGLVRIKLLKADVKVILADFFKADLSKADVVFCYLFPEIMTKLEPKFKTELRPGSRVVSYSFSLPTIKPDKVVDGKKVSGFWSSKIRTTGKIYVYYF